MLTTAFTTDSIVVGRSARMRAVFEYLRIIGTSDSTVLVTGESGTGKEVTATLIHQSSRRKHHPFVAVSCALFSETLIESELFGHERGAFTGAIKDRPGRFEIAASRWGSAGGGSGTSAGCAPARNRICADMQPMRTVPHVHVWAIRSHAFSSSRTFPGHP